MDTPSMTHPPADSSDLLDQLQIRVTVTDYTPVEVKTYRNGAELRIGGYDRQVSITTSGISTPAADLDLLERFLDRCLHQITAARTRLAVKTARQLPCGGICQPVTWPADGSWVCLASDDMYVCSGYEGHPGPHHTCDLIDGTHTVVRTWTTETVVA